MTKPNRRRLARGRLAYSIKRLARATDIGRSTIYEEINAGRLIACKVKRRTVIMRSEALRWLRDARVIETGSNAKTPAVNV